VVDILMDFYIFKSENLIMLSIMNPLNHIGYNYLN